MNILEILLNDKRVVPTLDDLIIAAENGHIDIVKVLSIMIDPSGNDNLACQLACENGYFKVVELLLQDDRVLARGLQFTSLYTATFQGNLPMMKLLIEKASLDPNSQDNICMITSCQRNFVEIVHYLISRGVDPRCKGNTPIRICCAYGSIQVFDLLIDQVKPDIQELLCIATQNGQLEILKKLVFEHDASIKESLEKLYSWAVELENEEIRVFLNQMRASKSLL
jgi:ankyrin repeat protein